MATLYNPRVSKIEDTHSLQELISIGNSLPNRFDYTQFCMIEKRDGVDYPIHNVIDDYIEELKNLCVNVKLTTKEVDTYKYNPKLLSYKLYKTTLYHHIILKLNNLCNVHEFTIPTGRLLLMNPSTLETALSQIYNSEKTAILYYNNSHKKDTKPVVIKKKRI